MKNRTIVMTALASSLLFIGAGCAKDATIAIPAKNANGESALQSADGIADRYAADPGMQDARILAAEEGTSINAATGEAEAVPSSAPATDPVATASADASASAPAARPPRPAAFPGVLPASEIHNKQVRMTTDKGVIVFELLDGEAPKAVSNFVALTNSGFYDGLTFHRVESWVVQGGDPLGTGTGGPGYKFEDEPVKLPYKEGVVAMANAGHNTNGSQFFFLTKDTPLKPDYTIFGRVIAGMDVVHQIEIGDHMKTVVVEAKK